MDLSSFPILSLIIFYVGFVNHIEPNQIGLARNHASGETWVQTASWHLTPPWVWVSRVESNPIRVGVPTAGRGFSAKLVRFLPEKADDFLNREGWRYYWWDNRISFNFGHSVICTPFSRHFRNPLPTPKISSKDDFCTQQVSSCFSSTVFFRNCSIAYIHQFLNVTHQKSDKICNQVHLSCVRRMIQSVHCRYSYLYLTLIESSLTPSPFQCNLGLCNETLDQNGSIYFHMNPTSYFLLFL